MKFKNKTVNIFKILDDNEWLIDRHRQNTLI